MSVGALPLNCLRPSPAFACHCSSDERAAGEGPRAIVRRLSHAASTLLLAGSDLYEAMSPSARHVGSEWRQAQESDAVRCLSELLHEALRQFDGWRNACGDGEDDVDTDCAQEGHFPMQRGDLSYQSVVDEFLACDLPMKFLASMAYLDFEAKKGAVHILCAVFVCARGTSDHVAGHVALRPSIFQRVLDMCADEDVFFLGSQIVRSMAQNAQLASLMFEQGFALQLLQLAAHLNFEISNEVFSSISELLLQHKQMAATYLMEQFEVFCQFYHVLLDSKDNYVIQRQSLKLLGMLLLDVEFQCFMLRYVEQERFLMIHMNLLRGSSMMIPVDAFHILKLFVANPEQPRAVRNIFRRNGRRLSALLETFRYRRIDDACLEDLEAVMDMLDSLPSPSSSCTSSCTSSPASR